VSFLAADWLPAFGHEIWDTSSLLSEKSFIGKMPHVPMGYAASPESVRIMAYFAALAMILLLARQLGRSPNESSPEQNRRVLSR
jgi:high-affinity iron transporter